MKHNNMYLKSLIMTICVCVVTLMASCSDEPASEQERIDQMLHSISTDWGCSKTDITKHMKGYVLDYEDNEIMIYAEPTTNQFISYNFVDGRLSASTLLISAVKESVLKSMIKGPYEYIGEVEGCSVYANTADNILASLWTSVDEYSAIGYAPVISEQYEPLEPYGVTTDEQVNVLPYRAEVSGYINGNGADKNCEAGIIYGLNPNLPEDESAIKSIKAGQGKFYVTILGMLGNETYYYRAYAIIDKVKYLGEIRSFKAAPMTYSIGGVTFDVVKVEGGPYGDFSIMQTEVIPSERMKFGDLDLPCTLKGADKDDENITHYELRKFIGLLHQLTGLYWRLPTSEEWQYAYAGGSKSKGYAYSGSDVIDDVAWYVGNSDGHPHKFDLKDANELGLYNMSGNYAELTCDNDLDQLKGHNYSASFKSFQNEEAYGGNWSNSASSCKKTSRIAEPMKKDVVSASDFSIRLVVHHHPTAIVVND